MNSTETLLDRHLECFGKGDLDGIVADYSSAAVKIRAKNASLR